MRQGDELDRIVNGATRDALITGGALSARLRQQDRGQCYRYASMLSLLLKIIAGLIVSLPLFVLACQAADHRVLPRQVYGRSIPPPAEFSRFGRRRSAASLMPRSHRAHQSISTGASGYAASCSNIVVPSRPRTFCRH